MIEKDRKIKGLKSQIKTLMGDAEAIKVQVANLQKEEYAKRNLVKKLQEEIDRYESNKSLRVSEHAIVRYFERVKGYDIEEIQKEILNENVVSLVEQLGGTGGYPNDNFKVVMKDYTVTTVV